MDQSLEKLINNFTPDNFQQFFRTKSNTFIPESISLDTDSSDFPSMVLLGSFAAGTVGLAAIEQSSSITEKSGKKKQFSIAKEIIKKRQWDGLIVGFYSKDTRAVRISFIRASYSGQHRAWSNWRRFTHYIDKDRSNKTFRQQFGRCDFSDLDKITDAFSVEAVNNEFYKEIAKFYDELVGTDKNEPTLKHPDDTEAQHEFAIRLIGRIIFTWFLREKTDGATRPLVGRELLSREAANQTDYYHTILAPLFFEVLNTPFDKRKNRFKGGFFADVPYLNGGLFTPQEGDHYIYDDGLGKSSHAVLAVPDIWLKNLFELLELYNFTVDENTTVDVDLSIDPEMLGRIFENLLARVNPETGETVRKTTGSFYTPREVVDFMVDSSLIEFLTDSTSVDRKNIENLVRYELGEDLVNPLKVSESEEILEALSTLTVLDPACGSGAFPIGMLQKIVFVISVLDPDAKWWLSKQLEGASPELRRELENKGVDYVRKLGIIRQTIFGVDIQPIATEISRLRCFLTLIVDEAIDDNAWNRGIRPLPNLDFKFVTANSLIKIPQNKLFSGHVQGDIFDDQANIKKLKSLRDEYFSCDASERSELKLRFLQTQKDIWEGMHKTGTHGQQSLALSMWDPFSHKATNWFDPDWMFGVTSFNILIANPPYSSKQSKENKELVKTYKYVEYKSDPYALFIEKGFNLLTEGGALIYITPLTWMTNYYYFKLRKMFIEQESLKFVMTIDGKVFDSANVDNSILLLKKHGVKERKFIMRKVKARTLQGLTKTRQYSEVVDEDRYEIGEYDEDWLPLRKKIEGATVPLGEISKISLGMKLKSNDEFVSDKYDSEHPDPIYFGKDISRYKQISPSKFFNYKASTIVGGTKNINVQTAKPKILIQAIRNLSLKRRLVATLEENGAFFVGTLNAVTLNDNRFNILYVLGLMNSSLLNSYYRNRFTTISLTSSTLGSLPIKIISSKSHHQNELYKKIVDLVRKLLNSSLESESHEYDILLDRYIYELYDLTPEEIKKIESQS